MQDISGFTKNAMEVTVTTIGQSPLMTLIVTEFVPQQPGILAFWKIIKDNTQYKVETRFSPPLAIILSQGLRENCQTYMNSAIKNKLEIPEYWSPVARVTYEAVD